MSTSVGFPRLRRRESHKRTPEGLFGYSGEPLLFKILKPMVLEGGKSRERKGFKKSIK